METSSAEVCEQLMRLLDQFKLAVLALAEDHQLTKMQLFSLYAMSQYGELAMGQAAAVLHCDASNVTGIVNRLVSAKLVESRVCLFDRRAKTLRLTKKGQALVDEFKAELCARFGCDKFTTQERQVIAGLAQKVQA